jgi:hypothetical protein
LRVLECSDVRKGRGADEGLVDFDRGVGADGSGVADEGHAVVDEVDPKLGGVQGRGDDIHAVKGESAAEMIAWGQAREGEPRDAGLGVVVDGDVVAD